MVNSIIKATQGFSKNAMSSWRCTKVQTEDEQTTSNAHFIITVDLIDT